MPIERRIITVVDGLKAAIQAKSYDISCDDDSDDSDLGAWQTSLDDVFSILDRFTVSAPSLVRREDAVNLIAGVTAKTLDGQMVQLRAGERIKDMPEWDEKGE